MKRCPLRVRHESWHRSRYSSNRFACLSLKSCPALMVRALKGEAAGVAPRHRFQIRVSGNGCTAAVRLFPSDGCSSRCCCPPCTWCRCGAQRFRVWQNATASSSLRESFLARDRSLDELRTPGNNPRASTRQNHHDRKAFGGGRGDRCGSWSTPSCRRRPSLAARVVATLGPVDNLLIDGVLHCRLLASRRVKTTLLSFRDFHERRRAARV